MTLLNPKRWQVAPSAPPSHVARFPHLHPIIVQVLYNRGITDPVDVAAFLACEAGEANPFALPDIHAAVTRLRQALRAEESIAVYGDFDADGVTATALLVQTLRALGGRVRAYIPDRVDEGYGLHEEALTRLAQAGVDLVVTVDCGVRALEEVAHANQLGLDVIVTDHHSVGRRLPDAVAVIDPKRVDSGLRQVVRQAHHAAQGKARDRPFDELAGSGVAYRLAQALLRSQRQTPVTERDVSLQDEDLVDLVALGTVADLVPLRSENRTLVHRGLERINEMERPGIRALCRQAGLKPGEVDATAIGYVLGPRLNAAGRLAHAETAYRLLMTDDPVEAEQLAAELDGLNRERQRLTREAQERARQMVLEAEDDSPLLFAAAPEFLPGIVGLVASRLLDEFYRPAVVVAVSWAQSHRGLRHYGGGPRHHTEVGDAVSQGSCRSIPEFNITRALDECADLLVRYGGHAAAAGFTVFNRDLDRLARRLRTIAAERLADVELTPVLAVDAEVDLAQMSWGLQQTLSQMEPCGYANPHPLFVSRNVRLLHQRAVGSEGRHLKLLLSEGRITWDAIAFRQGAWAGRLPDQVDIAYHLEVNEWNDQRRLQLNVRDVRPAGLGEDLPRLWLDEEGEAESGER